MLLLLYMGAGSTVTTAAFSGVDIHFLYTCLTPAPTIKPTARMAINLVKALASFINLAMMKQIVIAASNRPNEFAIICKYWLILVK